MRNFRRDEFCDVIFHYKYDKSVEEHGETSTQEWLGRFLSDRSITQRPMKFLQMVEQERHGRYEEMAKALGITHMIVWHHFKKG